MKLFSKISEGATKLFQKMGQENHLFRKISNTARKIDNSVAKVGRFLVPTAHRLGFGSVGNFLSNGVDTVHAIRNDLEKAIKDPVSDIRRNHYM
jgi:hypothetical protein